MVGGFIDGSQPWMRTMSGQALQLGMAQAGMGVEGMSLELYLAFPSLNFVPACTNYMH